MGLQDGSYLTDLLLRRGYQVHGLRRFSSAGKPSRIDHLAHKHPAHVFLHYGDLTDALNVLRILKEVQPDEIYNLGAQSDVAISFSCPQHTADSVALGTLRLLEALRISGLSTSARFFQASTSELFGQVQEVPQRITTPFYPRSPYAVAKLYAYWITVNYREAYGIFACNGVLFNHESPLRGETFVGRKITRGLARIKLGLQDCLYLGNLDAKRDWGHARDYVELQWLMLQQEKARDYVIATGEQHSVREFVDIACSILGFPIQWRGDGLDSQAVDSATGKIIVAVDARFFRPAEVDAIIGDPSQAKEYLGWTPKTSFANLVREMVAADLVLARGERR